MRSIQAVCVHETFHAHSTRDVEQELFEGTVTRAADTAAFAYRYVDQATLEDIRNQALRGHLCALEETGVKQLSRQT